MTLGTETGTAVGTTSCIRNHTSMAPGQERHLQKNVSIWLHFLKGLKYATFPERVKIHCISWKG